MDTKEMFEGINRVQRILLNLNTLVNKKWYDEQEEMIVCIKNANNELNELKNILREDLRKDEMCKKLRNLCDIFSACENCPLYQIKVKKLKCDVPNWDKLSKLKFEEVIELYNSAEEWVKILYLMIKKNHGTIMPEILKKFEKGDFYGI